MPKEIIRCSECTYCKEFRKYGNTRSNFFCEHPDQNYIYDYFEENRMVKMPGFLGFGEKWSHDVPLKTSPRWCPKKNPKVVTEENNLINEDQNKVKYAIYQGKVGLYAMDYVDNMERLQDFLCRYGRTEKDLPIVVNNAGGCTSFYPIPNNFIKIVVIDEDEDPLTREQMYPKNSPEFEYGWISPEGDTYNTGYEGHLDAAYYICKELGYKTYNEERELEEKGWIKISGHWSKGNFVKDVFFCSNDKYITNQQIAKLYDLNLHTNMYVKSYIQMREDNKKKV